MHRLSIGMARSTAASGDNANERIPVYGCTQTRRSANNRRRATARAFPFGQVMAFPTGAGRDESRPRSTSPFDEQLDAARKAISDCAAMLRAAELQLDDLQHTQIPDSGDATALSDRAFELRELLAVRLAEMDLGIRDARGGELPKRLSSGAGVLPRLSGSGSSQSFNLRHSGSSFDGHQVISPIGRDLPTLSPTQAARGLPCADEEAAQPCVLERVSAVLIDLDGTMYNPRGAIQGADGASALIAAAALANWAIEALLTDYHTFASRAEFYAFLVRRKIPYVFLSNTGAKGSQGTQDKLAKMGFMMQHRPVPLSNIYTAAQAQVAYMVSAVPRGSLVFVIAGNSHGAVEDSFWMQARQQHLEPVSFPCGPAPRSPRLWHTLAAAAREGPEAAGVVGHPYLSVRERGQGVVRCCLERMWGICGAVLRRRHLGRD